MSIGSPLDIAAKLNFLQRRSKLPLLIASDLEGGSSFRFNGGTPFPTNMGVGATGSERAAYQMGRITAIEGRAVGVHVTFSPVADVNNNPANPIINTRSFGGDAHGGPPGGCHRARHPGRRHARHGEALPGTRRHRYRFAPLVAGHPSRLASARFLELLPFRAAIAAGVRVVMSAHIALPALEQAASVPATLAPEILTGILRDSLKFKGPRGDGCARHGRAGEQLRSR
jgi:beta-N-acetylhexosaminidase